MVNKNNNSQGFTLAEILVAAGLLGVLSVGVVNIMSNINKTSKRASQTFVIEQEVQKIAEKMKDKAICEATLSDPRTSITATSAGTPTAPVLSTLGDNHDILTYSEIKDSDGDIIYQVYDADGAVDATTNLLDNEYGSAEGGQVIQLQGLRLQGWTEDEPTFQANDGSIKRVGTATFRVIFKKGRGATPDEVIQRQSFGSTTISRKINIKVIVNEADRRIESCFTNSDSYVEASCTSLGGRLDGNGQCVEYMARHHTTPAAPALTIGDAESAGDMGVGFSPLVITRVDGIANQTLQFDDNEIQSYSSTGIGGNLFLNRAGGNTTFGTPGGGATVTVNDNLAVNIDTTVGGDIDVSGSSTVDGNSTVSGNLSVGQNTTISGTTTMQGDATASSNLSVTGDMNVDGNTRLGNSNTDTLNIRASINNSGGDVLVDDNLTVTGTLSVDNIRPEADSTIRSQSQIVYNSGVLNSYSEPISTNSLVTADWVKKRIAKTLDPTGSIGNAILSDIATISASDSNRAATNGINAVDCTEESWSITGEASGSITQTWSSNRCNRTINLSNVENCADSGTCGQVCIDGVCRTSWYHYEKTNQNTARNSSSGRSCWLLYPNLSSWPNSDRNVFTRAGYTSAAVSYSSAISVHTVRTCGATAAMAGFSRISSGRLRNMWWPVCCHTSRW